MLPSHQGSFQLFRFAGINVYLHWSWFVVAFLAYQWRRGLYDSPVWNVLEYLALFVIVLLHEFGHSLACRQVGGQADQIILWPLGGVAFVSPPQRPGAMLWSIAAGPLVNVVLLPMLVMLVFLGGNLGWVETQPDLYDFFVSLAYINGALLIFNLLPVYPLDGGQILRSLLWFVVGRARSLMVASITGLVGVSALIGWALLERSVWMGIMSAFILMNCWGGLMQARALARMDANPRRTGFACPVCKTAPPVGEFWLCGQCRKPFDAFATRAVCPHCHATFGVAMCIECRNVRAMEDWVIPPPLPPNT
jgi:Zn-dependent protease